MTHTSNKLIRTSKCNQYDSLPWLQRGEPIKQGNMTPEKNYCEGIYQLISPNGMQYDGSNFRQHFKSTEILVELGDLTDYLTYRQQLSLCCSFIKQSERLNQTKKNSFTLLVKKRCKQTEAYSRSFVCASATFKVVPRIHQNTVHCHLSFILMMLFFVPYINA